MSYIIINKLRAIRLPIISFIRFPDSKKLYLYYKVTNLPKLILSIRSTISYIIYRYRYSYTKSRNSNRITPLILLLLIVRIIGLIVGRRISTTNSL